MAGIDALQMLVKMAGTKVIHAKLGELAVNGACLEAIGSALYNDEAEQAATRPWTSLTVREKKVWTQRASVAILGFREYILNPSPGQGVPR